MGVPAELPGLHFRRLPAGELAASRGLIGARVLSSQLGPAGDVADTIGAALLVPDGPTADAWFAGSHTSFGASGCVQFQTDGCWVHGSAQVDAGSCLGGLEQAAHRIYTDLFAALSQTDSTHLLRVWNYVPGINDEGDGLEHYRHFNAGRQRAFIDAGRSAFEGAPAACALGTASGPLRMYFLAGPVAPLAIENPRQISAYRYPDQYGQRSPTFSRAALVDVGDGRQALFISGTASIQGHLSMHVGDVRRQTEETLLNIDAVLQAARQQGRVPLAAADLTCTVYLRHPADLAVVREVLERKWGPLSEAMRTLVVLHADICRADLLVEIEAHGFIAIEGRT